MSVPLQVVAVNGSASTPSRTLALVQTLLEGLSGPLAVESRIVNLGDIARPLGGALQRTEVSPAIEQELQAIESADLLIAAAPVYRGSYPGHFKHLFDLVGQDALVDKPVLLAATGGSERHALVLDHQLRPLFSFFQSLTLPIGVYGTNADFTDYRITSTALQSRVDLAVARAVPVFNERHHRQPLRRAA